MKRFFFIAATMLILALNALATPGAGITEHHSQQEVHLTKEIVSIPQKESLFAPHYSNKVFTHLTGVVISVIVSNIHKIKKVEEARSLLDILLQLPQKCYMQGVDFLKIYLQEGLNYIDYRTKITLAARNYLQNIPKGSAFKIPPITHHIYFSIPDAPKQLHSSDEDKIIKSISLLNKEYPQFIHYFWTNVPDVISPKIKSLSGIQIKDISEFTSHTLWSDLEKNIDGGSSDKVRFVIASDITRLMVVEKYGGIYMDLDYEVYNASAMVQHMKNLNFFTGLEFIGRYTTTGNAFFAASAKHPVIRRALSLVARNIPYFDSTNNGSDVPEYIKKPCDKFYSVLSKTGPTVLGIAYTQANNKNGNSDLVLPAGVIFNMNYARSTTPAAKCHSSRYATNTVNFEGIELETIGADMFCSSWFH